MKRILAAALLAYGAQAQCLDIKNPYRFTCRQGDCVNGEGTVFDGYLSISMSGAWRNGETIPGVTYKLSSARVPGARMEQVYGADGLLASGDMPRPKAVGTKMAMFRGKYVGIEHPFLKVKIPVPSTAVYDTGFGVEYRGRFEFLPAKSGIHTTVSSGYFIFFGEKVDTVDGETETGLYVSGETLLGMPVGFMKAEPSYLIEMQKRYQRDMQIAQSDFAEIESDQKWRSALAVVGQVAFAMASGGTSLSSSMKNVAGEMVMGMVGDMLNKDPKSVDVRASAQRAAKAATEDQAMSDALAMAINEGISTSKKSQ